LPAKPCDANRKPREEASSSPHLAVRVVADKPLVPVRDVEPAVQRALERAEDARARRRALEARVQQDREGPGRAVGGLDREVLARGLLEPGVCLGEAQLRQRAARNEQAHGVRGGVVREPDLEAKARQLVRVGGAHHDVARQRRRDDLGDDVLGGEADDEAVLGGVEPVLGVEVGEAGGGGGVGARDGVSVAEVEKNTREKRFAIRVPAAGTSAGRTS